MYDAICNINKCNKTCFGQFNLYICTVNFPATLPSGASSLYSFSSHPRPSYGGRYGPYMQHSNDVEIHRFYLLFKRTRVYGVQ